MEINEHYNEVLRALHGLFVTIFTEIEKNFKPELALIRSQYPLGDNSKEHSFLYTEEPVIIHWPDAIELLRSNNVDADMFTDLNSMQESALGDIVKKIYKTDIFVVDQYPSNVRPFYTMVNVNDSRFSNSYDIFIRGQEICSGAQRQHCPELLVRQMEARGITDLTPFRAYLDSFSHGISPHAGAGIGLERLVALYLGLDGVKKASLFPRDPGRCTP
jgi:aspartyl-tRNA synthetase